MKRLIVWAALSAIGCALAASTIMTVQLVGAGVIVGAYTAARGIS